MFDSFTKLTLKMRTYYMTLDTNDLIDKILDNNILISSIAKEEFLKRDFNDLNIDDDILNKVISKLTIEEVWDLVNTKQDNHFMDLVIDRLNSIFSYYEKKNRNAYLSKVNDNKKIFKLVKK